MGPRIMYMAHPVGNGPERAENIARAKRWFAWLLAEYPDDAIVAPWILYCEALDESPLNRARGVRDDLSVLSRCGTIVLVGGRKSPGMIGELATARDAGLAVIDLVHLGDEPPVRTHAEARP